MVFKVGLTPKISISGTQNESTVKSQTPEYQNFSKSTSVALL